MIFVQNRFHSFAMLPTNKSLSANEVHVFGNKKID